MVFLLCLPFNTMQNLFGQGLQYRFAVGDFSVEIMNHYFIKQINGVNIRSGVFVVIQSLLALRLVLCNLKLNSLEQIARA